MKTICAALGMAALLTFSASADTLTLPKGHVLDFGDTVDILDGRQTYFGKQMKNWAEHEAVEKESKPQAAAIGIIGGADGPTSVYLTSKLAPDVSRLAAEALGELRVYQLRANTPEAFYESFVLSFSVDHKNPGKEKNGLSLFVKLMGKEMTGTAGSTAVKQEAADKKNAAIPFAGKMWKEAEIGEPYKQFLGKKGIRLYVSGETRWKEKKSRGGKVYRLAKVKAGLYTGGCLIPFFAEGLILEDGDSTTYTLFASDQKSGAYFVPYVEKAAREMK
jgi:hypothetical protein